MLIFIFFIYKILCVSVLLACISVHHVVYAVPSEARGRPCVPWIWSYIWCELPRGCWKWNLVRASHWATSSPWMPDFYIYLFARKLIVLACGTLFIFLNTCSAAVASPETQIWFSPLHSQAFPLLLCVNHSVCRPTVDRRLMVFRVLALQRHTTVTLHVIKNEIKQLDCRAHPFSDAYMGFRQCASEWLGFAKVVCTHFALLKEMRRHSFTGPTSWIKHAWDSFHQQNPCILSFKNISHFDTANSERA